MFKKEDVITECCDNQQFRYELKTPKLHLPAMYDFYAYIGIGNTTLQKYKEYGDDYLDVISWFKIIIQSVCEQLLMSPEGKNTNGIKFIMINNFGDNWREKQEISHTGAQPVTFVNDLPEQAIYDKD
jgi:hypothetical protein